MTTPQKLPIDEFEHFYIVGDSLCAVNPVLISALVDSWFGPEHVTKIIPQPTSYYNGRFSNGKIFIEILADEMPEFKYKPEYNFARGGAGTNFHLAEFLVKEEAYKQGNYGIVNLVSDVKVTTFLPTIESQYKQVCNAEALFQQANQDNPNVKKRGVFTFQGHNDILAVSIMALGKQFKDLTSVNDHELQSLKDKLVERANLSGQCMAQYYSKMIDLNIDTFIVGLCAPMGYTPYFQKQLKHTKLGENQSYKDFIFSMNTVFDEIVQKHVTETIEKRRLEGKKISLTFVPIVHADELTPDQMLTHWLDEQGLRQGHEFDINNITPTQEAEMDQGIYMDLLHPNRVGHQKIAKRLKPFLESNEPNFTAIYQAKLNQSKPQKLWFSNWFDSLMIKGSSIANNLGIKKHTHKEF